MGRRLAALMLGTTVVVASGCDVVEPSGAAPTDAPSSGTLATLPSTSVGTVAPSVAVTFDPDVSVPDLDGSRVGCVDKAGATLAPAGKWYRSGARGALALTGEFVTTDQFIDFTNAVDEAVGAHVASFVAEGASELAADADSCVSYRYVQFKRDDESAIIVAVWRVEGATDPFWVPNERAFVVRDEATLVSDGEHIRVVLVVAPDGTTVRVSAYGPHAIDTVAGWPSTITVATNVAPGPAPATVEQLIAIGTEVLSYSLRR